MFLLCYYLVFGQLQLAQDKAAKQVVDEAAAILKVNVENLVAAYAFAAIPARFALERSNWKDTAALRLSPSDLLWNKFPQAEAVLVYARGLGAARIGDVAAARVDLERLRALQGAMTAANIGYWPSQADIQIEALKWGTPHRLRLDPNPRSLQNFPMQANGAEMLRAVTR